MCALAVWQSKASIAVLHAERRSPTRVLGNAAPHAKLHRSLISALCFAQADDQHWRSAGSSQFARVGRGVDLRSTARKCAWVRTPFIADMSGWRHSVRKECCALSSSNRVCLNSCFRSCVALLCSALRGGAPARCLATHKCHKCALAVWQSKASIVVLRAEQRSFTRILGSAAPHSKLHRSLVSTTLLWPCWWPVLAICRQQVSLREWLKGGLKIPLHATPHCWTP